jgi:DnaJ-class molecular chaperone
MSTTPDCPTCDGAGVVVTNPHMAWSGYAQLLHETPCDDCAGTGQIPAVAS